MPLHVLGIAGHFPTVFNTAELGVCKPHHEVYRRVLDLLDLPAEQVVFTDDTPGWAAAAAEGGMHGIPFTGVEPCRAELRRLGVEV